jgi:hypothetical protein
VKSIKNSRVILSRTMVTLKELDIGVARSVQGNKARVNFNLGILEFALVGGHNIELYQFP